MGKCIKKIGIIGAGPSGLFAALLLKKAGFEVCLHEKYTQRLEHSKSIGIHAPSISLFEEIALSDAILKEANIIQQGVVIAEGKELGKLSFSEMQHPYPMVLTIPQYRTEQLLEEACAQKGIEITKGHTLTDIEQKDDNVQVHFSNQEVLTYDLLIAADGARSTARQLMGISSTERKLPDFYAMADFKDEQKDDRRARLYLHPEGIIESFPLPGMERRWICRFDQSVHFSNAEGIVRCVKERCGIDIKEQAASKYFSSFQPYVQQSHKAVEGKVILLGDALQAVSPIGGQGMNLGWLQARILVKELKKQQDRQIHLHAVFKKYQRDAVNIGKKALAQSIRNTWMGRSGFFPLKKMMAQSLSSPLFSQKSMEVFSMRWLEKKVHP